jgi:hypothetical protein
MSALSRSLRSLLRGAASFDPATAGGTEKTGLDIVGLDTTGLVWRGEAGSRGDARAASTRPNSSRNWLNSTPPAYLRATFRRP